MAGGLGEGGGDGCRWDSYLGGRDHGWRVRGKAGERADAGDEGWGETRGGEQKSGLCPAFLCSLPTVLLLLPPLFPTPTTPRPHHTHPWLGL